MMLSPNHLLLFQKMPKVYLVSQSIITESFWFNFQQRGWAPWVMDSSSSLDPSLRPSVNILDAASWRALEAS